MTSIFFGGGTPSLMSPDLVDAVISEIRRLWRTSNDLEISLEANPTSSEAQRFRGFSDAGVSRLSMGIQALNNRDLKKLGRLHSVEDARSAFDIARRSFNRVSFDLIYARQDQSLSDWKDELTLATQMAVDHLSLYQLTIEPGTAFGARYDLGKLGGLPSDDISADMYEITQKITADAGLISYETSNHARSDAESRHNLIYWRGGDYLGIGPGAHGRFNIDGIRFASTTELDPIQWLRQVETFGNGEKDRVGLSQSEQLVEYILMALRLNEGLDRELLASFSQSDPVIDKLNQLERDGYVQSSDERTSVTPAYRIVLNGVLREILA